MLTHKRFITYLVLFFSGLNKAQIYKMPNGNSFYREIEMFMSFEYLNLFNPNQHTEEFYQRGSNDRNFPFEIEHRKNVFVQKKILVLKRLIR